MDCMAQKETKKRDRAGDQHPYYPQGDGPPPISLEGLGKDQDEVKAGDRGEEKAKQKLGPVLFQANHTFHLFLVHGLYVP